jgi:hypothetical protein
MVHRKRRTSPRRSALRRREQTGSRPGVESLEGRLLLAIGVFSRATGTLAVASEVDMIPLEISTDDFQLRRDGAVIGVAVHPASAAATLDPDRIKLVENNSDDRPRRNRGNKDAIDTLANLRDTSRTNESSFNLSQLQRGSFVVQVRGEGTSTGAYEVEFFLAGDVNGDFQVDHQDLNQIASLEGKRRGQAAYREDADVDRSGVINKADSRIARQNRNVSTDLRPEPPQPPGNRPPILTDIGELTAMPGGRLDVELGAIDPDGDNVSFEIDAAGTLPTSMFDGMRHIVFTPAPDELGSYRFDVIASDGTLESRQTVKLNVVADTLTTTRLSGTVKRINGQPLGGVRVEVGAVPALTNANGEFLLDLASGMVVGDTIKVRAELLTGPETFPFIAERSSSCLGMNCMPASITSSAGRSSCLHSTWPTRSISTRPRTLPSRPRRYRALSCS